MPRVRMARITTATCVCENWIPPHNATLDQFYNVTERTYTYDTLNRLDSVRQKLKIGDGPLMPQNQPGLSYDGYAAFDDIDHVRGM